MYMNCIQTACIQLNNIIIQTAQFLNNTVLCFRYGST